jgi:ketosteroid isomerase-like protein
MKLKIFFICIAAVLASCSKDSSITDNELKQIITKKYEILRTSLKNGDPSYVINMHTEDAMLFKADGTETVGIKALKTFYAHVAASGIDIKSTPTTIEFLTDDIAFEVGVFHSTTKNGKQNSSKYVMIWKRIGSDWKIYKAIDQAKL